MSRRTLVRSVMGGTIILTAFSLTIAAQHARNARQAGQAQLPKNTQAVRALRPPAPGMQRVFTQHGEHNVEAQDVPATGILVPDPSGRMRQLLPDEITAPWKVEPDEIGLGADPQLKAAKIALAKRLVPILTKAAPNNLGRQAQFQWIQREDSPLIFRGWRGRIRDAEEILGGWHVTLWVTPTIMTKGGTWAFGVGCHIEEYSVDAAGIITLIRDYPHPNSPGPGSYGSG